MTSKTFSPSPNSSSEPSSSAAYGNVNTKNNVHVDNGDNKNRNDIQGPSDVKQKENERITINITQATGDKASSKSSPTSKSPSVGAIANAGVIPVSDPKGSNYENDDGDHSSKDKEVTAANPIANHATETGTEAAGAEQQGLRRVLLFPSPDVHKTSEKVPAQDPPLAHNQAPLPYDQHPHQTYPHSKQHHQPYHHITPYLGYPNPHAHPHAPVFYQLHQQHPSFYGNQSTAAVNATPNDHQQLAENHYNQHSSQTQSLPSSSAAFDTPSSPNAHPPLPSLDHQHHHHQHPNNAYHGHYHQPPPPPLHAPYSEAQYHAYGTTKNTNSNRNSHSSTTTSPMHSYTSRNFQGMQASRLAYEQHQRQKQQHKMTPPSAMKSKKRISENDRDESGANQLDKSSSPPNSDSKSLSASPFDTMKVNDKSGSPPLNINDNFNQGFTPSHMSVENMMDGQNSAVAKRTGASSDKDMIESLPQPSPLERFRYPESSRKNHNHNQYLNSGSKSFLDSATRMTMLTPGSINMTPASNTFMQGFDSVGFEDVSNTFVSPAAAMNRRGNSKRRAPYDLHEQAFVNDPSPSPTATTRDSSHAYCTPIVTGNNIRNIRNDNMSQYNDGGVGEQNYRPSPITGTSFNGGRDGYNNGYDSHLRHYHRPYPTIRGGHSSPRFDVERSPRTYSKNEGNHNRNDLEGISPERYETPMIHRASKSPIKKRDKRSNDAFPLHTHSNPAAENVYPYSDPRSHSSTHSYDEQHPPQSKSKRPYHQHHPHSLGSYGKDPYQYAPPTNSHLHAPSNMYVQNGSGYYSPYDPHNPMNSMSRNHPYHHGQYHAGNPMSNNQYHPTSEGPYSQYQHRSDPNQHVRQTIRDEDSSKRRRIEMGKSSRKTASKQPRRKKMYSDFVGVTYNKTHAKYQACITHYRKQHYLGRYKLAVDAARAYDQSAKLLKGDSWKINFLTEQDYEIAKAKELDMLERRRIEADMKKGNGNMNLMHQYDMHSRMVKERLGLRLPMSQDPSIVAEKMLKDRLTAVKKQAEDHYVQLKQSGMDVSKKNKMKKEDDASVDKNQMAKSAVTPSPHQSQSNAKPQSMLMNEPIMSPPAAFKSPSASESALSPHQNSPGVSILETKDGEIDDNISSPSMTVMPPPSLNLAPVSETKQSPDSKSSSDNTMIATVFSSPVPSSSAVLVGAPTTDVVDMQDNNIVDADGNEDTDVDDKLTKEEEKGAESNAEAAVSALLSIRQ